jgi:hypothetical protein
VYNLCNIYRYVTYLVPYLINLTKPMEHNNLAACHLSTLHYNLDNCHLLLTLHIQPGSLQLGINIIYTTWQLATWYQYYIYNLAACHLVSILHIQLGSLPLGINTTLTTCHLVSILLIQLGSLPLLK